MADFPSFEDLRARAEDLSKDSSMDLTGDVKDVFSGYENPVFQGSAEDIASRDTSLISSIHFDDELKQLDTSSVRDMSDFDY